MDMASAFARKIAAAFYHLDGCDLLHHKGHLTDEEGWKLKPELISYRDMVNIPEERWPVLITDFEGGVVDWNSWYKWRKLPQESPAALLMSFPMSMYQLITHALKLTSPDAASPNHRKSLNICLLGAEIELNFVPL